MKRDENGTLTPVFVLFLCAISVPLCLCGEASFGHPHELIRGEVAALSNLDVEILTRCLDRKIWGCASARARAKFGQGIVGLVDFRAFDFKHETDALYP